MVQHTYKKKDKFKEVRKWIFGVIGCMIINMVLIGELTQQGITLRHSSQTRVNVPNRYNEKLILQNCLFKLTSTFQFFNVYFIR